MENLKLEKYADAIKLDEPFIPLQSEEMDREKLVDDILEILRNEQAGTRDIDIPEEYQEKRRLVRALLNIRQPKPLDKTMMTKLDTLLQKELDQKAIIEVEELETISGLYPDTSFSKGDRMSLWQGDITELRADAVIDAANEELLGCMQPLHGCIDNAIHSAAGPRLRDDCAEIIHRQKEFEETGNAKITRAYNLPSKYVLHTVGPAVFPGDGLTPKDQEDLASCYLSCLELADSFKDIRTLVFPSISTGAFGFPIKEASEIAVSTVNEWLEHNEHHFERIIFNVFSDTDKDIYQNTLEKQ